MAPRRSGRREGLGGYVRNIFGLSLAFMLTAFPVSAYADIVSHTFHISAAELQAIIAPAFELSYPCRIPVPTGIECNLSNPRIMLTEGSDEVLLAVDVRVRLPGIPPMLWKAELASKLSYKQDEGALYLRDVRLVSTPDGWHGPVGDLVRSAVQSLMAREFAARPIYAISRESPMWLRILKPFLKGATVNEKTAMVDVTIGFKMVGQ